MLHAQEEVHYQCEYEVVSSWQSFLTCLCLIGILHAVYLSKSLASGHQGEKLFASSPTVALWSCCTLWHEGRRNHISCGKTRRADLLPKWGDQESAKRSKYEVRENLVETGSLSLQQAGPQPCFRSHRKEFPYSLAPCMLSLHSKVLR